MTDSTTSATGRRTGVLLAALVVVGLSLAVASGSVAAQEEGPVGLENCGSELVGPIYESTNGLEVEEAEAGGAGPPYPTFPDPETVLLEGVEYPAVAFSSPGEASLTFELRTWDGETCVSAVDATQNDVTIAPAEEASLTLTGEVDGLYLHDPDLSVDDEVDLEFGAPDDVDLTLGNLGLESGESVVLIDLDTGDHYEGTPNDGAFDFQYVTPGAYAIATEDSADIGDPASFVVSDRAVDPQILEPGESATISANVSNVGDSFGHYAVDVTVDGEEIYQQTLTVPGNGQQSIAVDHTFNETGEYQVQIDGEHAGTVTVHEVGSGPAQFAVSNESVEPGDAEVGEEVTVSATLMNVGNETGSHTLEITAGGEVIYSENITLDGGTTEDVEATFTPEEAGDLEVTIDGQVVDTVSVTDPGEQDPDDDDDGDDDMDDDDDEDGDDGLPLPLIGAAVVGLLVVGGGVAFYLTQK